MAAIPIQPVTVTIADLTAIKTALSDKADQLDRQAAAHRHSGPLYAQVRKELRDGARQRDALAARLSFAVAGEPIQVIEDGA